MIVADVLGPWWDVEATTIDEETGEESAYRDQRRQPQFLHDLAESVSWQDVTAQLSESIPPEPGYAVWRVWCDEAQLRALVAHPSYEILRAAQAAPCVGPPDWPRVIATPERDGERDAFPPLPPVGTPLEAGAIYQHGGQAVIVRQSHNRTEHEPADVPALFMVHREDAGQGVEWIAGEQVYVGTERTYEGSTYRCLQAHVTQSDWTPDATPALWAVVAEEPEPTDEWQVGVSYAIGDVVTYKGIQYECRQAHTSQAGWEPPRVLALWLPL